MVLVACHADPQRHGPGTQVGQRMGPGGLLYLVDVGTCEFGGLAGAAGEGRCAEQGQRSKTRGWSHGCSFPARSAGYSSSRPSMRQPHSAGAALLLIARTMTSRPESLAVVRMCRRFLRASGLR